MSDDVSNNFTPLENCLREENCRLRELAQEARFQRDNARTDATAALQREMAELRGRLTVASQTIQRLEDSLCMAICIIENEASCQMIVRRMKTPQETTLWRWAQELKAESQIDFEAVLTRREGK